MIGLLALQKKSNLRFIRQFYALAPAVYISHARTPGIRLLSSIGRYARKVFGDRGFGKINPTLHRILTSLCKSSKNLCMNLLFLVAGPEEGHMDLTRVPIYMAHAPSPTSVKNMVHFTQNYQSGSFRKFDYGRKRNLKLYNSVIV